MTRCPRERGMLAPVGIGLGGLLSLLLALHVAGVAADAVSALRVPLELDYGEGIVWQQAALIPGPRMYADGRTLPFIVFHYPPLYHLLAHAVWHFMSVPPLMAGRLVSAASMPVAALAVGGLAWMGIPAAPAGPGIGNRLVAAWPAAVAGSLALCLHAVRSWGVLMRVDMLAVALALSGTWAGAAARGRLLPLTGALLLCAAAAFTKQTQLGAGLAVCAVSARSAPRATFRAAALAGGMVLAALAWLQWRTSGGFLHNVVADNINRFSLAQAVKVLSRERDSLPFVPLMLLAALLPWLRGGWPWADRRCATAPQAHAMTTAYFLLSCLMLPTILKSGSTYNYFLECLCLGSALLGVWLGRLARRGIGIGWLLLTGALCASVACLPLRQLPDRATATQLAEHAALVRRIARADKPVASEDMTLLMQAGKPVPFEPAIVTELAAGGQWDESGLVAMIRRQGFAFMVVTNDAAGGTMRRSPGVDRAMRTAYPRVERTSGLWIRLPAE